MAARAHARQIEERRPYSEICELMETRRKFYSRAGVCVSSMGRVEDVEERIARIYLERVRKLSNARKTRNPLKP